MKVKNSCKKVRSFYLPTTSLVTMPKFTLHFFDTLLKNSTDKISLTKRLYILPLQREVTKRVYFIGNERMLIAHDSNRLRFS